MILFSNRQIIQKNKLYVPYYMRTALGLHNKVDLYLSLLESSINDLRSELVISQVPFKSRSDLWTIKISLKDRLGLLNDIVSYLYNLKLEVLKSQTFTLENNRYVNMEFLVDCRSYNSFYDRDSTSRVKKKWLD